MAAVTFIEFLEARIAEEEAAAQAVIARVGGEHAGELFEDGSGVADRDSYPSYPWGLSDEELAFMRQYDPARVLAECEAKRRIVKLHPLGEMAYLDDNSPACSACTADGEYGAYMSGGNNWPCPTLRALTVVYADHLGYDESWRP